MDMSKLSASDKRILYASIGVIIGGVVGIIDVWGFGSNIGGVVGIIDVWGFGSNIGLLAGIAAAVVVLLPQLAPTAKLPAAKGLVLLVCGAVAAGGFALSILTWLSYALDVTRIYTILFDLGFVAALLLLWFTWTAYKAEQGPTAS